MLWSFFFKANSSGSSDGVRRDPHCFELLKITPKSRSNACSLLSIILQQLFVHNDLFYNRYFEQLKHEIPVKFIIIYNFINFDFQVARGMKFNYEINFPRAANQQHNKKQMTFVEVKGVALFQTKSTSKLWYYSKRWLFFAVSSKYINSFSYYFWYHYVDINIVNFKFNR